MRKPFGKFKSERLRKKLRRKLSLRKKVIGHTERPRVCVVKTNKNMNVQVVDDSKGQVLFSLSTFGKKSPKGASKNKEGAFILGQSVAKRLKETKTHQVVFDRNGLKYHGLIAQVAEGLRKEGIQV